MAPRPRCEASRKDGQPCQAAAITVRDGKRVCQIHSLSREEQLAQMRRAQQASQQARTATKYPLDRESVVWVVSLIVSIINGSSSVRQIGDNLHAVTGPGNAADRGELENALRGLADFERREPPTEDQLSAARAYLEHGMEHGWLDPEGLSPELRELVSR